MLDDRRVRFGSVRSIDPSMDRLSRLSLWLVEIVCPTGGLWFSTGRISNMRPRLSRAPLLAYPLQTRWNYKSFSPLYILYIATIVGLCKSLYFFVFVRYIPQKKWFARWKHWKMPSPSPYEYIPFQSPLVIIFPTEINLGNLCLFCLGFGCDI